MTSTCAEMRQIAELIGIPVEDWPGNCYTVSVAALEKGAFPPGRATYGHWLGPVHKDCVISRWVRQPFVRHGWIAQPFGFVVDLTRWVFEAIEPYIYRGPDTKGYYDPGGNVLRAAMLRPLPEYDPEEKRVDFTFPPSNHPAYNAMMALLKYPPHVTRSHAFWLANLPLPMFGEFAAPIYQALIQSGMGATIPIDNRRLVLGEAR